MKLLSTCPVMAPPTSFTATGTVCCIEPPAPEHVKPKSIPSARGPTCALPDVALVPLQPPEAVQLVAFVELQVSVGVPLVATEVGLAERVTVGAGVDPPPPPVTVTVADCCAEPPPPEQDSV